MNNNHSHGGNFNAFLWGLIIGAGAVFLFGTKKGKRILKTISEEGLELKELFEEEEGEEGIEDYQVGSQAKKNKSPQAKEKYSSSSSEPASSGNGGVRRFFKGIPKR